MFPFPAEMDRSHIVASVEIADHPATMLKVEKIVLRWLNRQNPRVAPASATWLVFAINEMIFVGTLEFMEVELALKYNIGLGYGYGLPLDVYRRPDETLTLTATEENHAISSSSVEYLYETDAIVDLTRSADEGLSGRRKRRCKRVRKNAKRQRTNDGDCSTDDELEFWVDTMEVEDNENHILTNRRENPIKLSTSSSCTNVDQSETKRLTNLRIGVFCPRPHRSRLMNCIMTSMDNLSPFEPCPQFKRNGYSLDTLWFVAANEYSASWMISTVERISKQDQWRHVPLLVEPWNNKFVVKNVIQLTLPWKSYKGNQKAKVIQRLRKANMVHGSNRWNLIGCKLNKLKIQVTLAVNEQTMRSLKTTQFYVFYGFSQYRCEIIKTALK